MILLNIASKYIAVKLSTTQEAYIKTNIAREVLIFLVCWLGTRDIYISILLTGAFYILTQHLFNEESKFCILPHHVRKYKTEEVTPQEINDALSVLKRARQQGDDEMFQEYKNNY